MTETNHDEGPAIEMATVRRPHAASLLTALTIASGTLGVLFLLGFVPLKKRQAELHAEVERQKTLAPTVDVQVAKRSTRTTDLVLPGTVRAFQETSIYARTNGYCKRWLVDLGDEVRSGQLLAEIEVPELDQELDQARATLDQLRARVAVSKANVDLAESTFKRYETAAPAGGITQQELAEKRAGVEVAKANSSAATADLAAGEANVRRLTQLHSFADVTAPFSGTITARWIEVGTLVTAGSGTGKQLFKIVQTNPARVFVSVPQALAPSIVSGAPAELVVREHPGKKFPGTVARTAHAIDDASRTLLAEVEVPNPKGLLLAGMYTQVKFQVSHENALYLVPESALVVNADGTQLATVRDGKVHFVPVEVSVDNGPEIGISSGVGSDDLIIANPGEKIVEGLPVTAHRKDQDKKEH